MAAAAWEASPPSWAAQRISRPVMTRFCSVLTSVFPHLEPSARVWNWAGSCLWTRYRPPAITRGVAAAATIRRQAYVATDDALITIAS
jgi:hypothetical protein